LVVVAAAVAASLGTSRVARAEDYPNEAGWGVLSVIANVGYMPVKTIYAGLGGLTGGFAYVCTGGNYETASHIWAMSLGGTYALTPSMLRGEEPILFAGAPSDPHALSDAPVSDAPVADEVGSTNGRQEESLPAS
jgi:hypothetical protein